MEHTPEYDFKAHWPLYAMVIVAVLQAVVTVLDGGITAAENFILISSFLGAVATYLAPSYQGKFPWAKTVVAALIGTVTTLGAAAAADGITTEVIIRAAISFILGLGVVAKTEKYARDYSLAA